MEVYQILLEYSGVRLRFYIHINIIKVIICFNCMGRPSLNPVPNATLPIAFPEYETIV